ncbi:hypothetical protein ABZY19_40145 [Streptomyces sp. NPDC006475]|uniref:hypothetical protein n=1 Tax=Streptomyces sp. NPDC006475 TaxID=3155719 RepID=UPI0033A1BEB2
MTPRRQWWLLPELGQVSATAGRHGAFWHAPLIVVPAATLQAHAVLFVALQLPHLDYLFLEDNGMFAMCTAIMVFAHAVDWSLLGEA